MRFTVILTPDEEDGGYVVECPAIPGCISEGDTAEEALINIKEAIEGCLETLLTRQEPMVSDCPVLVVTVDADLPASVNTLGVKRNGRPSALRQSRNMGEPVCDLVSRHAGHSCAFDSAGCRCQSGTKAL